MVKTWQRSLVNIWVSSLSLIGLTQSQPSSPLPLPLLLLCQFVLVSLTDDRARNRTFRIICKSHVSPVQRQTPRVQDFGACHKSRSLPCRWLDWIGQLTGRHTTIQLNTTPAYFKVWKAYSARHRRALWMWININYYGDIDFLSNNTNNLSTTARTVEFRQHSSGGLAEVGWRKKNRRRCIN